MEPLSIVFITDSADRKRIIRYSLFERKPLYAFLLLAWLVVFVVLPVIAFIRSIIQGAYSLTVGTGIYLGIMAVYIAYRTRKALREPKDGPHEIRFSPEGMTVISADSLHFVPCTDFGQTENSRYFYIICTKGVACFIPKRYMNEAQGRQLENLFPMMKTTGKHYSKSFEGLLCDKPVFESKDVIESADISASSLFCRSAALLSVLTTLPEIFLFPLTLMFFFVFSVLLFIIGLVIRMAFRIKSAESILQNDLDRNRCFRLRFSRNFLDIERSGTDRVFYKDIISVNKFSEALCIRTEYGRYIIPYSERASDLINQFRKDNVQ